MYSDPIRRYLMAPVNGRRGDHYNGVGTCETEVRCRTNPDKKLKNRVKFKIYVYNGVILEARWEIFGDPVARAVASWCVEKIVDSDISSLANITIPERAALELEITNETDIRAGCMTVIQALTKAIANYSSSPEP